MSQISSPEIVHTGSEITVPSSTRSILIIDDEPAICRTLEEMFRDDGFEAYSYSDGFSALAGLKVKTPDAVLLDIWMPKLDGIQLLRTIKHEWPDLPVVMMSGHANIQTAVEATRLGASEFIEKPLDMNATLRTIHKLLSPNENKRPNSLVLDTAVYGFDKPLWQGKKLVQKTLAGTAILYGQGLHSGRKSGLVLEPLPENSGIHFVGLTSDAALPAHVSYVDATGFATSIRIGDMQISTTEHLLSALHANGITNLLVKCQGEVPVMDGSAKEFCELFDQIGVIEQSSPWFSLKIQETIRVGDASEFIQIEPAEKFSIDYMLSYPAPVGEQHFTFTLDSINDYVTEIAPARTFGFVKDIGRLQEAGLAQGGRFNNFVLLGEAGPVNGTLRFPDEMVRHKILDCIGDLFMLGRPIQGKVTACMTGHSDNVALLKKIVERMNQAV